MQDFRLKVFYSAAKNRSFTLAAQELYISQPAVTRHIKILEDEYQVMLFERNGNSLELTYAGKLMLQHVERILHEYHKLEYDMHLLNNVHVGQLRLGASTTISQYVLPPYLAKFIESFPQADISLINGNSRFIEHSLDEHNIDLGLIEGVTRLPMLTYTPFLEDELIILTGSNNSIAKKGKLSVEEFKRLPIVLRERSSGTLDYIEKDLQASNIKFSELNIRMYLGSTEAIKLFMQNSECLCILSKSAVKRELEQGILTHLTVDNLTFKRTFCFVRTQGPQSPLVDRFITFIQQSMSNQKAASN